MPDRLPPTAPPVLRWVLQQLLPVRCPACGTPAPGLCPECRRACRPAPSLPVPPGCTACLAVHAYDGPARAAVLRAKAAGARALYRPMGAEVARAVTAAGLLGRGPCLVTWPPTTAARRRRRGYDPAEQLARSVAAHLGLAWVPLLDRVGSAQSGLGARERALLRFAPRLGLAPSTRLLLVDDVRTTGATLTAAAGALREAGATTVLAITFAATPVAR